MTSYDPFTTSPRLKTAVDFIAEKKFEAAEEELKLGIDEAKVQQNKILEALFYSTLGMLFRLKGDLKTAWRHYDQAEKIFPEDPSLKLIVARLLIEVFGQSDTAIKKTQLVLKNLSTPPPLIHQAQCTLGLAYLKKGNKNRALECLKQAMENQFENLGSASNIDFKLFEALIKKKMGQTECKDYLLEALNFAHKTKEEKQIETLKKLLEAFEKHLSSS